VTTASRFSEQLDLTGAEETRSLEARRREPRTHSFRHQGALRRFQRDPAPWSGRPAVKKAREMVQSKRIDEFGAGRAALRKELLEVASIRCSVIMSEFLNNTPIAHPQSHYHYC
jgi:hypothetical protein